MQLTHIVIQPLNLKPVSIRRNHFPGKQIIHTGAPDHRMFTPCIGSHITTDGTGPKTGRIGSEDAGSGCFHHFTGYGTCLRSNRINHTFIADIARFHFTDKIKLLDINHHRVVGQRHRTTTKTGPSPTRNNDKFQFRNRTNQTGNFVRFIRSNHAERVVRTPVCRIRRMVRQSVSIKMDIIGMRVFRQFTKSFFALFRLTIKPLIELIQHSLGANRHFLGAGIIFCAFNDALQSRLMTLPHLL